MEPRLCGNSKGQCHTMPGGMFSTNPTLQVLELPDDFYPTDMHWMPRGGGGAAGIFEGVETELLTGAS